MLASFLQWLMTKMALLTLSADPADLENLTALRVCFIRWMGWPEIWASHFNLNCTSGGEWATQLS